MSLGDFRVSKKDQSSGDLLEHGKLNTHKPKFDELYDDFRELIDYAAKKKTNMLVE
jgi:hypothetical protein